MHLALSHFAVLCVIFFATRPQECFAVMATLADDERILFNEKTQNEENKQRQLWDDGHGSKNKQQKCCPQDAIGTIWGSLVLGVSRNPTLKDELFKAAIQGTAAVLAGDQPSKIFEKAATIVSEMSQIDDTLFDESLL